MANNMLSKEIDLVVETIIINNENTRTAGKNLSHMDCRMETRMGMAR